MQHPISVESFEESLRKMVRHESAEALGAIYSRWEAVEKILIEFTHDENQEVRESCLVALDTADYWGHSGETDEMVEEDEGLNVPKSFAHQKNVLVNHFNVE
jgi:hypothetical protein